MSSDDLNNKIKQITDILGQENIPDNVKDVLSALANQNPEANNANSNNARTSEASQAKKGELDENIEMVRKIKTIMDRINSNNDPRINLLKAIHPFLNQNRQKKVRNCIKLLHISTVTKIFEEQDKSFF